MMSDETHHIEEIRSELEEARWQLTVEAAIDRVRSLALAMRSPELRHGFCNSANREQEIRGMAKAFAPDELSARVFFLTVAFIAAIIIGITGVLTLL